MNWLKQRRSNKTKEKLSSCKAEYSTIQEALKGRLYGWRVYYIDDAIKCASKIGKLEARLEWLEKTKATCPDHTDTAMVWGWK